MQTTAQSETPAFIHLDLSAPDLIRHFYVDFDLTWHHNQAMGILHYRGAFEPLKPDVSLLDLAVYVGAHYCQMIAGDVRYQLIGSFDALKASQIMATELGQRLDAESALSPSAHPPTHLGSRTFAAYALARWLNAAGRIHYRAGDYTNARLNFSRAQRCAEASGLWFCFPDFQSDLIRAEFEEKKTFTSGSSLEQSYQNLLLALDDQRNLHGIPTLLELEQTGPSGLSVEQKEWFRGVSSVYHNYSIAIKEAALPKEPSPRNQRLAFAMHQSLSSSLICSVLGDPYRLAQALNQQAQFLKEFIPARKEEAIKRFSEALNQAGLRNQRIARQNIAQLRGTDQGKQELVMLLKELEQQRQHRGGDLGFDIILHYYTIFALKNLGYDPVYLRAEWLKMVRSFRRVAQVTPYKQEYAKKLLPVYLEEIGWQVAAAIAKDSASRLEPTTPEERVFVLAEESSARELLDLLREHHRTTAAIAVASIYVARHQMQPPELRRAGTRRRDGIYRLTAPPHLIDAIKMRQADFERAALEQPIETEPPNSEIGYEARMFTANHLGTAIVRYFTFRRPGEIDLQLGAFVLCAGAWKPVYAFDWKQILKEFQQFSIDAGSPHPATNDQDSPDADGVPTPALAFFLWDALILPVWQAIHELIPHNTHLDHLILIPSAELFNIPLHIAIDRMATGLDRLPLGARVPLSFSVSATALTSRGRHLLRRQSMEPDDDLWVLSGVDDNATGDEVRVSGWDDAYLHIIGERPKSLEEGASLKIFPLLNSESLAVLAEKKPEFLLFVGHGLYSKAMEDLGPALTVRGDILTQLDIAMRLRLTRNKLTVLSACMTGQGAMLKDTGEVSGFLRAFIAAGCGALALTLWPVRDHDMVHLVGNVLKTTRQRAAKSHPAQRTVDFVHLVSHTLRDYCLEHIPENGHDDAAILQEWIERCALLLYL